jgi:hypothetical protein
MNPKTRYSLNGQIEYATEVNCIKVYSGDLNKMVVIPYPEAALWNMIQQGYSFTAMSDMLAPILKKDKPETVLWMLKNIDSWIVSSLLSS